jgi:hypothetical protein
MYRFKRTASLMLPKRITLKRAFTTPDGRHKTTQIEHDNGFRRTPVEPIETPQVYLALRDRAIVGRDLGRYFYVLVMFLRRNGYRVAIKNDSLTMSRLQTKFGRLLLKRQLIQIVNPRDDIISAHVSITDDDQIPDRVVSDVCIKIVTGVKPLTTANSYDIVFPYMLHPTFYDLGYDLILDKWRREKRSVKVLFSGNVGPRYDNLEIWERFQKLSRVEVLSTLLQCLEPEEIKFIETETELPGFLANGDDRFCCIDTSRGFRIPKKQWLSVLGKTNFQICPPGVDMPLCHNIVEGMSVGCIPILEHPEYFDPPLRDNSNCIIFSGKEGLLSAVRRCLHMDEEEIRWLRHGTLHYYETHLSPEAFGQKLMRLRKPNLRLGMNFIH